MSRLTLYSRIIIVLLIVALMNVLVIMISTLIYFSNKYGQYDSKQGANKITLYSVAHPCQIPQTDVNNSEIMALMKTVGPIQCNKTDWVEIKEGRAFISNKYEENVTCSFHDIVRISDTTNSIHSYPNRKEDYTLKSSDFVLVKCHSENNKKWTNILAGIRHDDSIMTRATWDNAPPSGLGLNVLIFAIGSMSRNLFYRKLPKTVRYLHETLDSIEFTAYNTVGDGTFENILPLLTGKFHTEFPETRRDFPEDNYVDAYPFIWKEYKKYGYVTGYIEDCAEVGTFSFRNKEFQEAPTDHYGRPFYIQAQKLFKRNPSFCLGAIPRHKIMLNYVTNFFSVYQKKPKFMFAFTGELSHKTYNHIGAADEDIRDWLETLRKEGHLDNTLLIIMSDRGPRFPKFRNTKQGFLEERLPMLSIVLPRWFIRKNFDIATSLYYNAPLLTTPFDVHETLMNVLNYTGKEHADFSKKRSVSLFQKNLYTRSCKDAQVSYHWCTCINWRTVYWNDENVANLARTFVGVFNQFVEAYRTICAKIRGTAVRESYVFIPQEDNTEHVPIVFNESNPRKPDGLNSSEVVYYRLKLWVIPGRVLYDVTAPYYRDQLEFKREKIEMTRINPYIRYNKCLGYQMSHLQKYCICI